MVKGKTQAQSQTQRAKSQGEKKSSASAKSGNTPSSSQCASKTSVKAKPCSPVPSCCNCGTVISDDTKALQCDRCNEVWKCCDCLNFTGDVYDHLVADSQSALRWFCDICDKEVMGTNPTHPTQQNEKLDNLISLIERLMEKYETIETKLDGKCNVDEAQRLSMRIDRIEEKLTSCDRELEQRFLTIENQLQVNTDTCAAWKASGLTDEEIVKHAVQDEINNKKAEEKDLENRKCNIIIYRAPEKKNENLSERKESDAVFVKDLLDCVFDMKLEEGDIDRIYRLGRWSEDKTRPLLVAFQNCDKKEQIMSNLRNLKNTVEKFRGIGISPDLHPKERDEIKQLIQEAKQAHEELGTDSTENYRFLVVGQGQRKRVLKIKRQ